MTIPQPKLLARRHLVWLLWLVLLLPLAQVAASWHVLSHVNSASAADNDDRLAIQHEQCELCLSVAAVLGGAASACEPSAPVAVAAHERSLLTATAPHWRLATPAYLSRAPPLLLG